MGATPGKPDDSAQGQLPCSWPLLFPESAVPRHSQPHQPPLCQCVLVTALFTRAAHTLPPSMPCRSPAPRPQAPGPFWGTQAPQDAQDPSEDPGPLAFPCRPATKQRPIPFLRLDHVAPCSPPGRDRLWAQKVVLPIALLRWTEGGQSEMTPTALPSRPLRASVSLVPGHDLRTYCSEVSVELVVLPQISQEAGGRPGGLLTVGARGARVRGGHTPGQNQGPGP